MDWSAVPTFGEPARGMATVCRPSAYALLFAADARLAVVRTPAGVYLPGGGVRAKESVEAAIHREVAEECGARCTLDTWRAHAVDRVYAASERIHYSKQSTFAVARLDALDANVVEGDHQLAWLTAEEACAALSHTGQRWAVERWRAGPNGACAGGLTRT